MTEQIKAGKYKARAVLSDDNEFTTNERTGTKTLKIKLNLFDLGRECYTYLYFSENAEPYSVARLNALGWSGGEGLDGIDKNVVDVVVKYETYNGKEGMKVEIQTFSGGAQRNSDRSEEKSFFKNLSMKHGKKTTTPEVKF